MQKKVHRKLNKKALLVIVLTLYLFIMAFYYCFNLPIKSIVIKGNTNTLDEEIIKLGNINSYNKILGLNTKKVKNDREKAKKRAEGYYIGKNKRRSKENEFE